VQIDTSRTSPAEAARSLLDLTRSPRRGEALRAYRTGLEA
jgi:hypothetical protein